MSRIFYLIFAAVILLGVVYAVISFSDADGISAGRGTMIAILGLLGALITFVVGLVTRKKG